MSLFIVAIVNFTALAIHISRLLLKGFDLEYVCREDVLGAFWGRFGSCFGGLGGLGITEGYIAVLLNSFEARDHHQPK